MASFADTGIEPSPDNWVTMEMSNHQYAIAAQMTEHSQLADAEQDLYCVQELLRDVVADFLVHMLAVKAACLSQQQVILGQQKMSECVEFIALCQEIDTRSNELIVNLKFQDQATKLLGQAMATIDFFRKHRDRDGNQQPHVQGPPRSEWVAVTTATAAGYSSDQYGLMGGSAGLPRDFGSGQRLFR